jgi:hypothetical protein
VEIELTGGDGIKIDCPSALATLAPTNKQARAAILTRKFSLPQMFLQMDDNNPKRRIRAECRNAFKIAEIVVGDVSRAIKFSRFGA